MPPFADAGVVLNVQGDEPFVPADAVRGALERVRRGDPIGTAAAPLSPERAGDPNRVKVMVDRHGHAVNFSRAALSAGDGVSAEYLQHVGVYAYTRNALLNWVSMAPVPEETRERLEQLRPLGWGVKIGVAVLDREAPPGIDTEDDLRDAEAHVTRQNREVTA
jgi:3-deoxy-manno-octulosonate cytidylyltransferase (CMP-KDO synthetase)